MDIQTSISIIGAFVTITLAINAFFLRGIFQDLNDVKVHIAEIHADSVHRKEDIKRIESDITSIMDKLHKHSNMLQKHDGIIQQIQNS